MIPLGMMNTNLKTPCGPRYARTLFVGLVARSAANCTNVSDEGVSGFDDTRDVRRAQVDEYRQAGAAQ